MGSIKLGDSKLYIESIVGAACTMVIVALMAMIVFPILDMLAATTGIAMFIQLAFAAIFMAIALNMHKGKENLPEDFVKLMMILAFASLLSAVWPAIELTYEFTLAGFVMILSEAYLGLEAGRRILEKL